MNIAVALLSVLITVGIIACLVGLNKLCKKYLGAELIEVLILIAITFIIVVGFVCTVGTIYDALMSKFNLG